MKLDNLHGTKGNVTENLHDIHLEIKKLVGGEAGSASLDRQKRLIQLLEALDEVRRMSVLRGADWYLEAVNIIQCKVEEL